MHPTLLIGPADWDRLRLPREEFDARLAALWEDHWQAGGAIVYGEARDHAALAYLTHFTPKLEAALALIPRDGEPQLLIGGGVNMLPVARPLTFIERLLPLRGAAAACGAFAQTLPGGSGIVLIGGDAMPYALRRGIDEALGPQAVIESGDAAMAARRRIKSEREMAAAREACVVLDAAVTALVDAHRSGRGVTDCVLAAEHAALRRGAQDVRSLFSRDGGRTLRPFDVPLAQHSDPLQVYLAVRHTGYWAEGFVTAAVVPGAALLAARRALREIVPQIRPGQSRGEIAAMIADATQPHLPHPAATALVSLGLSLDEPDVPGETLQPGELLSLRAGVADGQGGAIVSAMLAVTAAGADVLWMSPGTEASA